MGEKDFILEVKKKKIFETLPNSLVEKALKINKENVKNTRAFLRKYFGVFLTNKVLKGKNEEVLKSHISSKKRDYDILYEKIYGSLDGKIFGSLIDLGCGANGFSYPILRKYFQDINYIGIEASGDLVNSTNKFFDVFGLGEICNCIWLDLFDLENLEKIFEEINKPRLVFLFQVIDALEIVERDFGKKLLSSISELTNSEDRFVLSYSLRSISGRTKFYSNRNWLKTFLNEHFQIIDEFEMFDEFYIILKNKK